MKLAGFLLAGAAFAADLATKYLIHARVGLYQTIPVVPGFLNIVHAENPGVAFSIFADSPGPWRDILLITLSSAAVVFLVFLLASNVSSNTGVRAALALILGGALGNLCDRLAHGAVTDFVEVYAGPHYFPAFNVADSCITVGAILLFLDMWRARKGAPAETKRVS